MAPTAPGEDRRCGRESPGKRRVVPVNQRESESSGCDGGHTRPGSAAAQGGAGGCGAAAAARSLNAAASQHRAGVAVRPLAGPPRLPRSESVTVPGRPRCRLELPMLTWILVVSELSGSRVGDCVSLCFSDPDWVAGSR